MAESTKPAHATLAVVFQVRSGKLQVLLWERAKEPFAGAWSLPGGYLEAGETLEDSIRRHLAAKGRRARALPPRATRDSQRARSPPARVAARDGLPRRRAARGRSRAARGHGLAPGRPAAASSRSTTARSRSPAGSGCGRSSRTRTSASRSRRRRSRCASCGTSTPLRSATMSRRRTSSACSFAAACSRPTGERRSSGRAGGRPAELFRFSTPKLEVTDQFAVLRPPER